MNNEINQNTFNDNNQKEIVYLQNNNTNIAPQNNLNNLNKKNNKPKTLIIIIGIVGVITILLISKSGNILKRHSNTTGLSEYSASDVDLNCVRKKNEKNGSITIYSDFLFNYNTGINYHHKIYNKIVTEYTNGLTEEKYKEFIKSLNSSKCNYDISNCMKDHLELELTSLGWDTKVDRIGNTIETTFYEISGSNRTATNNEIKKTKTTYEKAGFSCH